MAQNFGYNASLTLRNFLTRVLPTIVSPHSKVKQSYALMALEKKVTLVVDNGELVSNFGFKYMMSRVTAKELPSDLTIVSTVMTPNPETDSPEMLVIEALQNMHDNNFLTLPLIDIDISTSTYDNNYIIKSPKYHYNSDSSFILSTNSSSSSINKEQHNTKDFNSTKKQQTSKIHTKKERKGSTKHQIKLKNT